MTDLDHAGYSCRDYLASEWATTGLWDESAQLMFVVPASDAVEHDELEFLEIGRPGSDGILLGYRLG